LFTICDKYNYLGTFLFYDLFRHSPNRKRSGVLKYGADWNRQDCYVRLVSMQEDDHLLLYQMVVEIQMAKQISQWQPNSRN